MTTRSIIFLFGFIICLNADFSFSEDIVLKSGKTYKNIDVYKQEEDRLLITHQGGIATIYFKDCPKDIQRKYNHNSIAASERAKSAQAKQNQLQKDSGINIIELNNAPISISNMSSVISYIESACVKVVSTNGSGTGFFVTPNGYILTCYHVIEGALDLEIITKDNRKYNINSVIDYSCDNDLALIKVGSSKKENHIRIRNTQVNIGEDIFTIGHPWKDNWVYTKGYISAPYANKNLQLWTQCSIDISPGNSGGPIVDTNGLLCAIADYVEFHKYEFKKGVNIIDPSKAFKFGISRDVITNFLAAEPKKSVALEYLKSNIYNIKLSIDACYDALIYVKVMLEDIKMSVPIQYVPKRVTCRTGAGNHLVESIIYTKYIDPRWIAANKKNIKTDVSIICNYVNNHPFVADYHVTQTKKDITKCMEDACESFEYQIRQLDVGTFPNQLNNEVVPIEIFDRKKIESALNNLKISMRNYGYEKIYPDKYAMVNLLLSGY